jgi:hypothetical protein
MQSENPRDEWLLCSMSGEVRATPDDSWPGPSDIPHATVWGIKKRDELGMDEALLVNYAREYRRHLGSWINKD